MQKLNFWHSPYVYAILCLDFAFLHCKSSTLIQNFSKFSIVMTKTKIGTVIGMHQTISSQVLAQKSDIGFFHPPPSVYSLPVSEPARPNMPRQAIWYRVKARYRFNISSVPKNEHIIRRPDSVRSSCPGVLKCHCSTYVPS